jgi:hypothetical protein
MSKSKEYPTVGRFSWPGAVDCYLVLSCRKTDKNGNGVAPVVSFLCIVGDVAAEWEPTGGPIQLFFRGDDEEHYTFPRIRRPNLDFSQLSVEREGLPGMANSGNYEGVFSVLRDWADRKPPEENADE